MGENAARSFMNGRALRGTELKDLVVLVEDDDNLRENLEFLFKAERIQCLSAADGMSGLAMIRRSRPKVVVLDMYVPHRSGYEIIDDLRRDPVLAPIFIIATTGMAHSDEELRGMKHKADIILPKPFNEEWLLDLIREGLQKKDGPGRLGRHRQA